MKFNKPPLTYEQQADLLLGRGLVGDRDRIIRRLKAVGYYRLCGYWHPFKQPDESFVRGTDITTVWDRYTFDRRLRLSVMDGIDRVEIALRCALVDVLALRFGAFAHLDPKRFPNLPAVKHVELMEHLTREAQRSKEVFVRHFEKTYDEFPHLPIWTAGQIMSFGNVVTLFRMTDRHVQKEIAATYDLPGTVLSSWLLTLNYVRNVCAHHSRLWNRELSVKPLVPDPRHDARWHTPVPVRPDRVFVVLTQIRYLLGYIAPRSDWKTRLFEVFDRTPDIPLASMGMPNDWRTHALWK